MVIYLYRLLALFFLILLTSCLDDPVKSSIEDYYLSSITKSDNYVFATSSDGSILRSIDGENWKSLPVNNSIILLDIKSTPSGMLFACGESGAIFESTNNGDTWSKKSTGIFSFLKEIIIYNDSTIFAGGDTGKFIKSIDSGNTWKQITMPFSTEISAMALQGNQIYIGLRGNSVSSPLIYKYDIIEDTTTEVNVEVNSFVSEINSIDGEIYFSDYKGTYLLEENNNNYSLKPVYQNSNNNFIAQKILVYENQITLIGYYGFNLGEVIFDPKNNIQKKDFEESIYFNSGIVYNNKLILCGGDEKEFAILQNSNWKIIKLK